MYQFDDDDDDLEPIPTSNVMKPSLIPATNLISSKPPVSDNQLFGPNNNKPPLKNNNPIGNILIAKKEDQKKQLEQPKNIGIPNIAPKNSSPLLPSPNHSLLNSDFGKKQEEKQSPLMQNDLGQGKIKIQQSNPKKSNQVNIFKLIDLLKINILPIKLNESESLKALLSQTLLSQTLRDFYCITCKKFSFLVKLTCSHSACLFCLQSSLSNLANSPSLKFFKQSRCKSCFLFPTKKDIGFVLSPIAAETVYNLSITKQCTLCERNLKLMTNYLPELECLHLCRECYLNDMLYGGTNCSCCSQEYEGIETTQQRVVQCSNCPMYGKIMDNYYRALHSDHYLCANCLLSLLGKGDYRCPLCEYELDSNDIGALHMFVYKACPQCNIYKPISGILECPCPVSLCHDCFGASNHICS